MADALRLAKAVVDPIVRLLVADRRQRDLRSKPLTELINVSLLDDYQRRRLSREVEAISDAVAQRLDSFSGKEWDRLDEGDRVSVLSAVGEAFESADLSDAAILRADADPLRLARDIRRKVPDQSGLSDTATAYYERLLTECCTVYAQLVVHLPVFSSRGLVELLGRTSSLSAKAEQILERLPLRTLDAPTGEDHDAEFLDRYLGHVSTTLDTVELFGLDVRNYRPANTLSVAYISLTASLETRRPRESRWPRGEDVPHEETGLRIEHVLNGAQRILLRGDAGSGKTTLLHWLAVTAARGAFKAELSDWNGVTPLLVKLRGYAGRALPTPEHMLDGVADPLVGLMPAGWVHRQLADGRALILVDGVDELAADDRRAARDWIRQLLAAYPNNLMVVTSRPHAASARWLGSEGFDSAVLDRMHESDVRKLIEHWHEAIRDSVGLPCAAEELPGYERALLAQLDASPHLQGLATNPLLCAMLCALNLDRRSALPLDRMSLYKAALDMLLERRDVERRIPTETQLRVRDKVELLQYLAWRLSVNNRTQMSHAEAARRLAERLASMPSQNADPQAVLDHLLHRSGVIRQPADDRIDFVHRTFQEYLTAREAAEQGDVGLLVGHAHLDTWRETIIMAAGHGNWPTRHELLAGLLERVDNEPRHARAVRLLAAACLETVGSLDNGLRPRIEGCLASLIPPRRSEEARSLASVGEALLDHAPADLSKYSIPASCAMIESVALLGTPKALRLLSRYATDDRYQVQRKLFEMCGYFHPKDYAENVLARLTDYLTAPWVRGRPQLQAIRYLPNLTSIGYLNVSEVSDLSRCLAGLPPIAKIWLRGDISDVSALADHADSLTDLVIWSDVPITTIEPVSRLAKAESIIVSHPGGFDNLNHLENKPALRQIWLHDCDRVTDFTPLLRLPKLSALRLHSPIHGAAWEILRELTPAFQLDVSGSQPPPGGLAGIVERCPGICGLRLMASDWLDDIADIDRLPDLDFLDIDSAVLTDITPLRRLPKLTAVDLDCPQVTDLTPLADLPSLHTLYIRRGMPCVDISPLAGRDITIYLHSDALVRRWRPKMGRQVKLKSI